MNIFLTGATGYLGGAIARELHAAGHKVTGLAHSATSARKLQAARVVPHSGSLADAAGYRIHRRSSKNLNTVPTLIVRARQDRLCR
jgi:uncharacterized protein YbjT (DUF2867 family)